MKWIKSNWAMLVAIGIGAFLLYSAFKTTRDFFYKEGYYTAKAEYEEQIEQLDRILEFDKDMMRKEIALVKDERNKIKKEKEDIISVHQTSMAVFKSQSAAKLREKQATIDEILIEKEKDEIALADCQDTIEQLNGKLDATLIAWKLSDERIEKAHLKIVQDLELKYTTCTDWKNKLEKEILKKKTMPFIVQAAIVAGSFALGKAL